MTAHPNLLLVGSWMVCQICAWFMLSLGAGFRDNSRLLKLGQIAHGNKLKALDHYWPLTRIKPALAQKNYATVKTILTVLICLKSFLSFGLGIIMLFWLPVAAFFVPSIVAIHRPKDKLLSDQITSIARWQVSSHAMAAACGFTVFYCWFNASLDVVKSVDFILLLTAFLISSIIFARIAAKREFEMIVNEGVEYSYSNN